MYSTEMAELSGPHSSSRVVIWGLYEGRFSDLPQKQKLTQGRTKPFKKKKDEENPKSKVLLLFNVLRGSQNL